MATLSRTNVNDVDETKSEQVLCPRSRPDNGKDFNETALCVGG